MRRPANRILTGLALAGVASTSLAQAPGDDTPIEEVVVTASPIRDSQAAALEAKRLADNYVDIVSADTIGRFPDQNLADSIGRLPGVAIERDQGQARYLNLRGAPFRWTSIAFDGIDVPGAENGRIPRFDSFPATITSRVEVNKAILPSMPGESVAGFVNVHTFNPFDVEGPSLAVDVGFGEQDLGGGDVDRFSLRGSWSGDNIGFVGFASQNSREQITDNREYDLGLTDGGEVIVNSLDFRSYKVTREDAAYGGRVEYRGEGRLESVFASTLYSEFVDKEERNQWVFDPVDPQPGAVRENVPLQVARALEYGRYDNSTASSTLGVDFRVGEWRVETRLNYTETDFEIRLPIPQSIGGTLGSFDVTNVRDPIVTLVQPLDTIEYAVDLGIDYASLLSIEAGKFKFDAERQTTLFGDTDLKVGVMLDRRDADGYAINLGVGFVPESVDIGSFDTGNTWYEGHTTNSIGGTYYDNIGLRAAWADAGGLGPVEATPDQLISIDEDIYAAYAMATTHFSGGNIVYGLRVEQTDYRSRGTIEGTALDVDDSFTNWLPSIHLNLDLTDDLKLRLSGSTGVNRPNYNEWRAAASINVVDREVTGGNPFLDAEKTWGGDAALEWYFADASIVSAGAFYRHIDDVIYNDLTIVDGGDYYPPAAGQNWQFSGAVNGREGELKGLELNFIGSAASFLDGPLSGFGISGNVTFLDSEFTALDGRRLQLPGTSDLIYNIGVFYELFGLSARIDYQYRDEWVSPIESPDEVWGEQERLDLSLIYTLPFDVLGASASLYLNANNLSDENDVRFAPNGTINQSESFGWRYLFGVRVDY
jgi:TonB-dependent receptor